METADLSSFRVIHRFLIHRLPILGHEIDIYPRTDRDRTRLQRGTLNRNTLVSLGRSPRGVGLRRSLSKRVRPPRRLLRPPRVGDVGRAVLDLDGDDLPPDDARVVIGLLHRVLHGVHAGLAADGIVGGVRQAPLGLRDAHVLHGRELVGEPREELHVAEDDLRRGGRGVLSRRGLELPAVLGLGDEGRRLRGGRGEGGDACRGMGIKPVLGLGGEAAEGVDHGLGRASDIGGCVSLRGSC